MSKVYSRGFVFLYNELQKDYYLDEGCPMVDSNIHPISKKQFWVFKYDDVQVAFDKWCNRKHSK